MPIRIKRAGVHYSPGEVAEMLGFSRMHVWRLIESGEIRACVAEDGSRRALIHEGDLARAPDRKRAKKK